MNDLKAHWLEQGLQLGFAYATECGLDDRLRLGRIARAHTPEDVKANLGGSETLPVHAADPVAFWSGFAHGVARYLSEQGQLGRPASQPLLDQS